MVKHSLQMCVLYNNVHVTEMGLSTIRDAVHI